MNAPTPAQAAARRLQFVDLPRSTHKWHPKATPATTWRPPSVSEAKVQRARELEANGMTRREISNTLGVSRALLKKHLGSSRAGRKSGCKNFNF